MHSAQNFGAHNFVTTTLFESGLGDRPSGPNLGLRNEISYREGLEFASKDKKRQGLAKKNNFLIVLTGVSSSLLTLSPGFNLVVPRGIGAHWKQLKLVTKIDPTTKPSRSDF